MPFNVLKCYQCKTFQTHPQIKATKWRCKMCNEKQSFIKVYLTGSAPDCRRTVQDLNMKQGEAESIVPRFDRFDTVTQPKTTSSGSDRFMDQGSNVYRTYEGGANHGTLQHTFSSQDSGEQDSGVKRSRMDAATAYCHTMRPPSSLQPDENDQQVNSSRSKWEKYLQAVEPDDSSSEDDDTSVSTLTHQPLHSKPPFKRSKQARAGSRQQPGSKKRSLFLANDEDENVTELSAAHSVRHSEVDAKQGSISKKWSGFLTNSTNDDDNASTLNSTDPTFVTRHSESVSHNVGIGYKSGVNSQKWSAFVGDSNSEDENMSTESLARPAIHHRHSVHHFGSKVVGSKHVAGSSGKWSAYLSENESEEENLSPF